MTDLAAVIDTVQVGVRPVQAPDHPENTDPEVAAAVSVTWVPVMYGAEHTEPHEIGPESDVTVPEPDPLRVTESVKVGSDDADAERAKPVPVAMAWRPNTVAPAAKAPVLVQVSTVTVHCTALEVSRTS